MMIHDQLLSTHLLRDVKNEHSGLLQTATSHALHAHNLPALNMDLYSAYAFQAHIQQQQHQQQQQQLLRQVPEVLDLSRRCDSVETSRKTPSPYHTNSSAAGTPPSMSPTSTKPFAMQQQMQPTSSPPQLNGMYTHGSHQLPTALYPMLYFSNNITAPEVAVSTTTTTAAAATVATTPPPPPITATKAEATTYAGTLKNDLPVTPDSSKSINLLSTTPKTSNARNNLKNTQDVKSTRPFKAFPRDPLVIAANFAATDILLDNPRVERYTEYRKRVLEQIRNSNGGSRTITNPKMRRTSSRSNCISEAMATTNYNINNHSEIDEGTVEESSDCDSNAGNFERMSSSMTSSTSSNEFNDTNNNLHGSGGSVSTTTKNNKNGHDSNYDSSKFNSTHGQLKDAAYYERRRKNNAAAKKSRDRRRIKEDEIAIRAAYLERQNIELLCQIDALKAQLAAFTSKVAA